MFQEFNVVGKITGLYRIEVFPQIHTTANVCTAASSGPSRLPSQVTDTEGQNGAVEGLETRLVSCGLETA